MIAFPGLNVDRQVVRGSCGLMDETQPYGPNFLFKDCAVCHAGLDAFCGVKRFCGFSVAPSQGFPQMFQSFAIVWRFTDDGLVLFVPLVEAFRGIPAFLRLASVQALEATLICSEVLSCTISNTFALSQAFTCNARLAHLKML